MKRLLMVMLLMLIGGLRPIAADTTYTELYPVILDNCTPRLDWLIPAGGETLRCNDSIRLRWTAQDSFFTGDTGSVWIELWTPAGRYGVVRPPAGNSGEYLWSPIPDVGYDQAWLVLWAVDSFGLRDSVWSRTVYPLCDLNPPTAHLLSPGDGFSVACDPLELSVAFSDDRAVVAESIAVYLSGGGLAETLTVHTPAASYVNDTLRAPSSQPWPEGVWIDVRATVVDQFGNALRNTYLGHFRMDLTPPVVGMPDPVPGRIPSGAVTISIPLSDALSGVEPFSIRAELNGTPIAVPPARFTNDTLYLDLVALGYVPLAGESLRVCVSAADDPDICGPNYVSDVCWTWIVGTGPSLVSLLPSGLIGCDTMTFVASFRSDVAMDTTSFRVSVNGTRYTWPDPALTYIYAPPVNELRIHDPRIFAHGTTVICSLQTASDQGGLSIAGLPIRTIVNVDLLAPTGTWTPLAGTILSDFGDTIVLQLSDAPAGINWSSLVIRAQGTTIAPARIDSSGGRVILVPDLWGLDPCLSDSLLLDWTVSDRGPDGCVSRSGSGSASYPLLRNPVGVTVLSPSSGGLTACLTETLRIRLSAAEGIDTASLRIILGRDTLRGPELVWTGDSLFTAILTPRAAQGETLRLELSGASNLCNSLAPFTWTSIHDFAAPTFGGLQPDTTVWTRRPPIAATIQDFPAGVDRNTIWISVGNDTFRVSRSEVTFDGTTARLDSTRASYIFPADSTVRICVGASDLVGPCGPNSGDTCWTVPSREPVGPVATWLSPPDDQVTVACSTFTVRIQLVGPRGIDTAQVRLSVDGAPYSINNPVGPVTWAAPILSYTPPLPWADGTTHRVALRIAPGLDGTPLSNPDSVILHIDRTPPALFIAVPADRETVVTRDPSWSLRLTWSGAALVPESILVSVGDSAYRWGSAAWSYLDSTLTLHPGAAGQIFAAGESIYVCLNLQDDIPVLYCGPNRHHDCVTVFIEGRAPTARLLWPSADAIIACDDSFVTWEILGPLPIVPESLRVVWGAETLGIADGRVRWTPPTLQVGPLSGLADGTVLNYQLLYASDSLGNRLTAGPGGTLTIDRTGPTMTLVSPTSGDTIETPTTTISIQVGDAVSPVLWSSLRFTIGGVPLDLGSSGVTRSSGQVTVDGSTAGLLFPPDAWVLVCLTSVADSGVLCGPNRTLGGCDSFFYHRGAITVLPGPSAIIACAGIESAWLLVTAESSIDLASIRATINGADVAWGDPRLTRSADTLRFSAGHALADRETLDVAVSAITDSFGNVPAGLPFNMRLIADFSPPVMTLLDPVDGSVVPLPVDRIRFTAVDAIAGLDATSPSLTLGGTTYHPGDVGVEWDGTEFILRLDLLSITFAEGETVRFTISACDDPDSCGPNCDTTAWSFRIQPPGGDTLVTVERVTPPDGAISTCPDQGIVWRIVTSPGGATPETTGLVLHAGGERYTGSSPEITLTDSSLTFTPSAPYAPGETLRWTLDTVLTSLGHLASGVPNSGFWRYDSAAPHVTSFQPGDRVTVSSLSSVLWVLWDDLLSSDPTTIRITVTSATRADTLLIGTDLVWSRDSLTLSLIPAPAPGETLIFGLRLTENRPDYCLPRSLDTTFTVFISPLVPPDTFLLVRSDLPPDGWVTSCPTPTLRWLIVHNPDSGHAEPDPATLHVNVQDHDYTVLDPEIRFFPDSVLFVPSVPWTDADTIRYSLDSLRTTLSNPAESLAVARWLVVDLSPPVLINVTPPLDTLYDPVGWVTFEVTDSLAGMNWDSCSAILPSGDVRPSSSLWRQVDATHFQVLLEGWTVRLRLGDAALGCGANYLDTTLTWPRLQPEIKGVHPRLFTPNGDGDNDFVHFDLGRRVTVKIYDSRANKVRELTGVNPEWDGRNDAGLDQPPGNYLYLVLDGVDKLESGVISLAR